MMETCGTCEHRVAVNPEGHWRPSYGLTWHTTHVHCRLLPNATARVLRMAGACTFDPPRYTPDREIVVG